MEWIFIFIRHSIQAGIQTGSILYAFINQVMEYPCNTDWIEIRNFLKLLLE